MLFNSIDFLIFFPVVYVVYYIFPAKLRYIWLLAASYYFYMQWNPIYILLLFGCTLITYAAGLIMEHAKKQGSETGKRRRRTCLFSCVAVLLLLLGFFKYFDLAVSCLNTILRWVRLEMVNWKSNVILPVGISFYILQTMGYLIDVYRDDIYAEKNFFKYALFVSFFPQLVAGPIERSRNLLVQLQKEHKFCYEELRKGILLILYGLFCKIVIADRIAVIVDTVYDNYEVYPGLYIVFATLLFSIQIYCDFYGYSTIARGAALSLGIRLTDNFQAPYFSKSVKEFWRRWHISLSTWFRDYLYIPLGGNRRGKVRREMNLLFVFGVSGLWHGALLGYIFWGFLNGIYQVIGDIFTAFRKKAAAITGEQIFGKDRFSARLLNGIFTFGLVSFAWLFFRAGGFRSALRLIESMTSVWNWNIFFDGSIYQLGVAREYMLVTVAAILVLMLVDSCKYHGRDVAELVLAQGWWFRVVCYASLMIVLLVFGCYGEIYDTQQFIYFQF